MTPSKPPPPYEQLLPLPTPCFKMFLERSLNAPHPHHPTSSIFHCYPSLSTTPSPLKILIIHEAISGIQSITPKDILEQPFFKSDSYKIFVKRYTCVFLKGTWVTISNKSNRNEECHVIYFMTTKSKISVNFSPLNT